MVGQLIELQRRAAEYARRDGRVAAEDFFYAEQNARLVKNAEQYYRTMFRSRVSSCNLRDQYMAETLSALVEHLASQNRAQPYQDTKVVVWAHNSHLGDARATQMGRAGEWNLGQLVREKYGRESVLVGLSTYAGTVTAASNWGDPAERKRVRPAMPGSYEQLFHDVGIPAFKFTLPPDSPVAGGLCEPGLERAIGVIYRPESELASHYFRASLSDQFDAILHFDLTRAVEPLELTAEWGIGEPAETFPSGV